MKKIITFGEIMMRLSPPGFQRFSQADTFDINFGGSEANVAVSLAQLGIPSSFVTRLPENTLGQLTRMDLQKYGVQTDKILTGGDRLGIYFLETGASQRGGNVIYDRENSSISTIKTGMIDWDEIFHDAQWFHWSGITPAISQSAADVTAEALDAAVQSGITISVDFNFRAKLWNYGKKASDIMPELVEKCDVILANELDAEQHFGIQPDGELQSVDGKINQNAYISLYEQLTDRLPRAKKIISTRRESFSASHHSWSAVLYNGNELFEAPTYQITHIVDRVGGGDSFAGGLIYGLLTYKDDQKALNFAVAASCLKHTIPGDANLVTTEEVEALMEGKNSGKVSR
ncbi:sugar kinase [Rhodohalobacter sp. SW132]|uniref:sugar kinase n=1 Tax=Rhodohalobacter sp. SW132 TaxID=2293433 RepID=UPI000E21F841|nr:sugar kinase [Rhodohalobacter sp. SW132]REL37652.1 sugar kinase [Rhodohalobacter sp. SW132]